MRQMMDVCDECGTIRRSANHWFLSDEETKLFRAYPWDKDAAGHMKQYCGEACLSKAFQRWMTGVVNG